MASPLTNSDSIRADSVEVWNPLKRKYQTIQESVVGLAPEDLNSIELLAQAIGNDPNYFDTVAAGLSAKADAAEVAADFLALSATVDTKASSSAVAEADAELQEQINLKASSASVAELSSQVDAATASLQGQLDGKQAQLTQLEAAVVTKASQAQVDFIGQNFQPTVEASAPLSLVPRFDPEGNPFAELSIDTDGFATQAGLSGVEAAVATIQADVSFNSDAVTFLAGSKQDVLIAGSPADGYPLLSSKNVRGLSAAAPLTLANDGTHLTVGLSQSYTQGVQDQLQAQQSSLDFLSANYQPAISAQAPLQLADNVAGIPVLSINTSGLATQTALQDLEATVATKASSASVADALSIKADQNGLDATNAVVATKEDAFTTVAPLQKTTNAAGDRELAVDFAGLPPMTITNASGGQLHRFNETAATIGTQLEVVGDSILNGDVYCGQNAIVSNALRTNIVRNLEEAGDGNDRGVQCHRRVASRDCGDVANEVRTQSVGDDCVLTAVHVPI